jgi:hypothetical protein
LRLRAVRPPRARTLAWMGMSTYLADGLFTGAGQGSRQLIELLVAFGLTALVGLERETRGKSAGLRTQRSRS